MSELPKPRPPEENVTRRQFLRGFSYVFGTGSAFLIGRGIGTVINATRADPEARRINFPAGVIIQGDQEIRTAGQLMGSMIALTGLVCALVSYRLNQENSPK